MVHITALPLLAQIMATMARRSLTCIITPTLLLILRGDRAFSPIIVSQHY